MGKKTIDFRASISDVKQVNPLFSTCKVRVLYTGKNRNMSIITKEAVDKALPTLAYIPIIGEYSTEKEDWKGHGGSIDMDTYDFVHTTKPYGVVPADATFEWEMVGGREYLTINGCYLWTGRYPEAYSVIERAKGQSMEIEVTNGSWVEEEEAYQIDNFIFSALCILGDDVTPAFEEASISAYSLQNEGFTQEFSKMLDELKTSLGEKEGTHMEKLKQLLEQYSTTMEELTAKGLVFEDLSEDELEARIVEALANDAEAGEQPEDAGEGEEHPENADIPVEEGEGDELPEAEQGSADADPEGDEAPEGDEEPAGEEPAGDAAPEASELDPEGANAPTDTPEGEEPADEPEAVSVDSLMERIEGLENDLQTKDLELNELREFKLGVIRKEHEAKVQTLFNSFQMTEEDVKDMDIHELSFEAIEEKCYAIIGRKLAKKNFSKENNGGNVHLKINKDDNRQEDNLPYGGLIEKYKNKK